MKTMNNVIMIFGFLIVIAVVVIGVMIMKMKKRKLSGASRARIEQAWSHVVSLQDPVRRVIEADKVLDIALGEAGFAGTLGEKLKKAGPRLKNINDVWNAHKLRNQLAHESGARVSDAQANAAINTLRRAIDQL
jgi:hypothetical protein